MMLDETVLTAGDLMTRDVITVHPETSLLDAVTLLAKHRISGMPVLVDGTIVGMLSESDLVRWHEGYTERQARWLDMLADGFSLAPEFLHEIREQHRRVNGIMTPGAITVNEEMPAREIAHLMYRQNIGRLPVVRDAKLIGIVSRSDLIRALATKLAEDSAEQSALRRGREH